MTLGAVAIEAIAELRRAFKYSEDQPRDELGRFGEGGGGVGGGGAAPTGGRVRLRTLSAPDLEDARSSDGRAWQLAMGIPGMAAMPNLPGIDELSTSLAYVDTAGLKGSIMQNLAQTLPTDQKGSIACQTLAGKYGGSSFGGTEQEKACSAVIGKWAATSGDASLTAITTQMAVMDEFADELAGDKPATEHFDKQFLRMARSEANNVVTGEPLRQILRAQYEETQRFLESQGIEELILYRGVENNDKALSGSRDVEIELQPISSFSLMPSVAAEFAGAGEGSDYISETGAIIAVRVPRERVFSTFRTGFGCTSEAEVVVLGGRLPARSFAWTREGRNPANRAGDNPTGSEAIRDAIWGMKGRVVAQALKELAEGFEFKYSEDQPRDELGRFGEGGGGGGATVATGGAGRVGRGGAPPTAESARAALPVAVSLCEGLPLDPYISHTFQSTDSFQELETSIRYVDEHGLKHGVMAQTGEMLQEMGVSASRCMDLAGEFGASKYGDNAQEQAASAVTAKWADTSGDSSPTAIATQFAAASEFADEMGEEPATEHFPELYRAEVAGVLGHGREGTLRAVLRAQYENTQEDLRQQGIDELVLYRGIGNTHGTVGPVEDLDVELQPLSSFTLIPREALRFASHENSGGIIAVRVPRERVFSTFRTGLGCVGEAEVVILGGKVSARGFGWSREAEHPLRLAPLGENNSNTTVARNLWGVTDIR